LFSRRPNALNRQVLVNLVSGNAIAGVCTYNGRTALVVRGATIHEAGAEPATADGEIMIDRINVDFIQLLGPG
jgi:hypothetical protein